MNDFDKDSKMRLFSIKDECVMWYKCLEHINAKHLVNIANQKLVFRLPKVTLSKVVFYNACSLRKQVRTSFKSKDILSTTFPLQLQHSDLFGPIRTISLGKKSYELIIVDDFSRFTWVLFLINKYEVFMLLKTLLRKCRMKQVAMLSLNALTLAKNLKIICLKHFFMSVALVTISLSLDTATE